MNIPSDGAIEASGGLVTHCAQALGHGLSARQILAELERREVPPRRAREILILAEARTALRASRPLRLLPRHARLDAALLTAMGLTAGLVVSWFAAVVAEGSLGLRIPAPLGAPGGVGPSDLPATLVGAGAGLFVAFATRRFGRPLLVAASLAGVAVFLALAPWIRI